MKPLRKVTLLMFIYNYGCLRAYQLYMCKCMHVRIYFYNIRHIRDCMSSDLWSSTMTWHIYTCNERKVPKMLGMKIKSYIHLILQNQFNGELYV